MLQWLGETSEKSSGGCFFPSQAEFQGCHWEQLCALNADGQLVLVTLPHQLPPCFKKILIFLFRAAHYRSAFAAVQVQWKGTNNEWAGRVCAGLGRWCLRALYWQPIGGRANSLVSNSYSRFWLGFSSLTALGLMEGWRWLGNWRVGCWNWMN